MIADIDKDGSGTIDFEDFLGMMTTKMGERDSKEEILKAFRLFDDDETGKISFKNLKRVAKELGESMTDEELQARARLPALASAAAPCVVASARPICLYGSSRAVCGCKRCTLARLGRGCCPRPAQRWLGARSRAVKRDSPCCASAHAPKPACVSGTIFCTGRPDGWLSRFTELAFPLSAAREAMRCMFMRVGRREARRARARAGDDRRGGPRRRRRGQRGGVYPHYAQDQPVLSVRARRCACARPPRSAASGRGCRRRAAAGRASALLLRRVAARARPRVLGTRGCPPSGQGRACATCAAVCWPLSRARGRMAARGIARGLRGGRAVRGSLAALWVSQPASLPCTCMHASATAHGLTGACQLRGPEPVTGLWMLCHVRHAPVALAQSLSV